MQATTGKSGCGPGKGEQGYVLLTLLLIVALLTIAAAMAASSIAFKIKRDREEELIHRGAAYSRAIRRFTKKMGRYPVRLEDLENTDGLRFLRKRYKDPVTGQDFKLLHMADLQRVGIGGLSPAPTATGNFGVGAPAVPEGTGLQPVNLAQAAPPPAGAAGDDPAASEGVGSKSQSPTTSGAGPAPTTYEGAGVIVGVASASQRPTIREFNRKNHYNDWLFFYDPAYDRGFEIKGPTQFTNTPSSLAQRAQGNLPDGRGQPAPSP
jgi:type II secretory pathway pseudopilin PulG